MHSTARTRLCAIGVLSALIGPVQAQSPPTEFPADSASLSAEDLSRKLSGKVFSVRLHSGDTWRLDYRSNGYMYVNVGSGGKASGTWRTENGRLCADLRNVSSSCNEVREQGQRLFLKRDSGEVVALDTQ